MSCGCTGVITGLSANKAEPLLAELRALLAGTPVHLFCPPQYEEPFLRELPPAERFVLSFADNPVYDNCDHLFQADAADCMRLLSESAELILAHNCGCELFITSISGAALADYTPQPVTPEALHCHLLTLLQRRTPGFCTRFILRRPTI